MCERRRTSKGVRKGGKGVRLKEGETGRKRGRVGGGRKSRRGRMNVNKCVEEGG